MAETATEHVERTKPSRDKPLRGNEELAYTLVFGEREVDARRHLRGGVLGPVLGMLETFDAIHSDLGVAISEVMCEEGSSCRGTGHTCDGPEIALK